MRWASLTLIAVGTGLGCGDGVAPNEGLHSTVVLDRHRLVRGDSVQITVTVKHGALAGSSTCLTGYSVLDATGTVVAPGDVVCTADFVIKGIPAGGYVRGFWWAGHAGSGTSGTPLAAGIYRIVGGPGPPGAIHESVSEPVSLELEEPTQ